MKELQELIRQGGPVMVPIMVLSVMLYGRCFQLFRSLRAVRRTIREAKGATVTLGTTAGWKQELQETFARQRFPIAAMIAAAPLLGLLGTVTGMIGTFQNLADWGGEKSMEGLARGISEVLICTESGLAVAIPAIMALYLAHRQSQKGLHELGVIENRLMRRN